MATIQDLIGCYRCLWRSRRRLVIRSPGEAIPFGRPYRTHPNGPRKLLTARKRVGPFAPARRISIEDAFTSLPDHHFTLLPVHLRFFRQFILLVWMAQIRSFGTSTRDCNHLDCVTLEEEHPDIVRPYVDGVAAPAIFFVYTDYHLSPHQEIFRGDPCIHSTFCHKGTISISSSYRADRFPTSVRFRDLICIRASLERDAEVSLPGPGVDVEVSIRDTGEAWISTYDCLPLVEEGCRASWEGSRLACYRDGID
ncbi:hypothetical protein Tco_0655011 [Tanacetum coccineum]|uniref:Uncharacterized protein n=1 Tax=Tanacetum coccineum TaxID=301880 RepID=A0ABQ4X4S9_9ASTR